MQFSEENDMFSVEAAVWVQKMFSGEGQMLSKKSWTGKSPGFLDTGTTAYEVVIMAFHLGI